MRTRRSTRSGVTLIELMVVVAIIGLFVALVGPAIFKQLGKGQTGAAKSQIESFMTALGTYKLDVGTFPTTEQGLQALASKPATPPIPPNWKAEGYLERLPKDPWGNPYQYLNPGLHGEIDVFTFGADGAAGGEGLDADIGSWNL